MYLFRWSQLVVGIGSMFFAISSIAYAQSCPACNTAPDHIDTYIQSMSAVLDYMDTVIASQPQDTSTPDPKNITSKTNAQESLTNSVIKKVVGDPTEISDNFYDIFSDFKSLQSANAITRDKQKLTDIAERIAQQSLAMTMTPNTLAKKEIDTSVLDLKIIDDELKKLWYISLASTGRKYNLSNDNTYEDLYALLKQINSMYAQLFNDTFFMNKLAIDSNQYSTPDTQDNEGVLAIEDESTTEVAKILDILQNKKFELAFEDVKDNVSDATIYVSVDRVKFFETVKKLANDYACAEWSGNVCADGTKEMRDKNRELYKDRIVSDASSAKNIIEKANNRLRGTFGADADASASSSQSQQSLDQSKRWENWPENNWTPDLLRSPVKTIVGLGKNLWTAFWSATEPFHKLFDRTGASQNPVDQKIPDTPPTASKAQRSQRDKILVQEIENLPQSLLASNNDLRIDQVSFIGLRDGEDRVSRTFAKYAIQKPQQVDKDLLYANTNTVTKQMVWISKSIHQAANTIWDYNKEWTLNHALVNMCEKQCPDLAGKNCRVEN